MNPETLESFNEFKRDVLKANAKGECGPAYKSTDPPLPFNDLTWKWFVEEHIESDGEGDYFAVYVYEFEGVRYEHFYRFRRGTWMTPAGELRPCSRRTKLRCRTIIRKGATHRHKPMHPPSQ